MENNIAERRRRYELLRTQARGERDQWIPIYRELADYIIPRRVRGLNESPSSAANRGDPRNDKIIDNEAGADLRSFTAGLMGVLTNPARPWFKLAPDNAELLNSRAVKLWCEESTRRIADMLAKSNFYQTLPLVYADLGCFGTGAMFMDEDVRDGLRCYSLPIGTYMLGCSAKQRVDVLIREYSMTVRQMVEEFGLDNVSRSVADLFREGTTEAKRDIVHIICPNSMWDDSKLDAKYLKYSSCYYEMGTGGTTTSDDPGGYGFLRESGYAQFPAPCPRWCTTGEDIYGSSQGMEILGDTQQLQMLQRRKLQAIDQQVRPSLQVPAELDASEINMLPGGITPVNSNGQGKAVTRLFDVNFELQYLLQDMQEVRQRIKRGLFVDLWLLISEIERTGVTATEIQAKQDEKLQQLIVGVNNVTGELLSPAIDRAFSIALKRGLLSDPPMELQGVELKVDYVSTFAQALKAASSSGIGRFLGILGNIAQSKPDVADNVDFDDTVRTLADDYNVPASMIRAPEDVAKMRMARAAAAQQAAQAEQFQQVAAGAALLSKAQANTTPGITPSIAG